MMALAWVADYRSNGGAVHCGRGCRECCTLTVNCTLAEAVVLAGAISDAQAVAVAKYAERLRELVGTAADLKDYLRRQRREAGECPLLDTDGACGAYALRLLSCRALISTKESRWCGADFAELSSEEKRGYVDSLDRSVVAFPLHYSASMQDTGREMETRALSLMQQRFGFAVYGCMPVLVHLVRDKELAEAVNAGAAAIKDVLRECGFDHPFLVDITLPPVNYS